MTFEAFVDAVDAALRPQACGDYGLFRGPHVAYWQYAEMTVRLREGRGDDVELTVTGQQAVAPLVRRIADVHVADLARAIETAFSAVA